MPKVLQEKIFEGFYHIRAWWPSWSCDLDHIIINFFSPSQGGATRDLALIGQAVSDKMFENI